MDIAIYVLLTTVIICYAYTKWKYSYWSRRGAKSQDPKFFQKIIHKLNGAYFDFKAEGVNYGGLYAFFSPIFLPVNIGLIKNIMQNDFDHFVNRGSYVNEKTDPLSANLFDSTDEKWRQLRAKLTPVFTSGKIKAMFPTLKETTHGLLDVLATSSKLNEKVDIKDVMTRFTTDSFGSIAFGLECNALKDPNCEFRKIGKKMVDDLNFRQITAFLLPHNFLHFINYKGVSASVEKFFLDLVAAEVKDRELHHHYRKDFMQLLIELKNRGKVTTDDQIRSGQDRLGNFMSISEMAAQAWIFFGAGFETSATTSTFVILELALNQGIQEKLRKEIKETLMKHDGKISYEAIMEMEYLDRVVKETMRKHPPVPFLLRECKKDYQVPGESLVVEAGTLVIIPVQLLQRDPEHYANPEIFDPDRFSQENKGNIKQFAYIPFGDGPRSCIGARFGLMQVKVGIHAIINNFRVSVHEKTKVPIEYGDDLILTVKGGLWLNVEEIC